MILRQPTGTVLDLDPNRVRPFAEQPREYFDKDELINLELSIKARGQLQPGMVRAIQDDRDHEYELVDGQRRWHACIAIGVRFRAILIEPEDIEDQFEISVAANFQRAGHVPMEIAKAIERICRNGKTEAYVARLFGYGAPAINQYRKLIGLVPEFQPLVSSERNARLSVSVAIDLAKLPAELQRQLFRKIEKEKLSAPSSRDLIRDALIGQNLIRSTNRKPSTVTDVTVNFIERTIKQTRHQLQRFNPQQRPALIKSLKQTGKLNDLCSEIDVAIDQLRELQGILRGSATTRAPGAIACNQCPEYVPPGRMLEHKRSRHPVTENPNPERSFTRSPLSGLEGADL